MRFKQCLLCLSRSVCGFLCVRQTLHMQWQALKKLYPNHKVKCYDAWIIVAFRFYSSHKIQYIMMGKKVAGLCSSGKNTVNVNRSFSSYVPFVQCTCHSVPLSLLRLFIYTKMGVGYLLECFLHEITNARYKFHTEPNTHRCQHECYSQWRPVVRCLLICTFFSRLFILFSPLLLHLRRNFVGICICVWST